MRALINWILLACWLRFIFGASTDAMSAEHTSHFLFPLLRWLSPGMSAETMDWIHFFIRKGAHMTEYGILYLLSWRVFQGTGSPAWKWRRAVGALLFAALFAASDEYHQSFVPSRQASVRDVMIDITGASLALLCIWAWKRRRRGRDDARSGCGVTRVDI
jgi:VanZ family protein